MIPIIESLTVCNLYIAEGIGIHKHPREHSKGNVDPLAFSVDRHILKLLVRVRIPDGDVSAFAHQLRRGHRLAV